ncbi:hypothetical protein NDU88_005425 [Pleurodeles waltl]|uniref:Uncharacterized protein n=1 Tax=Pleurodeles waltl TaxID=8319 RepID=A0AAV7PGU4_PLEWA|nr:hypothetical protein NDU88_005425 [Pleurodeles waltl]
MYKSSSSDEHHEGWAIYGAGRRILGFLYCTRTRGANRFSSDQLGGNKVALIKEGNVCASTVPETTLLWDSKQRLTTCSQAGEQRCSLLGNIRHTRSYTRQNERVLKPVNSVASR